MLPLHYILPRCMYSPSLDRMQIPETVWLPPEIRSSLEASQGDEKQVSPRAALKQNLNCLLSRIAHVESLVGEIKIEERLERLEPAHVVPQVSRRAGA
jgi:hypothetical protein